jgi:hypothetical protein
MCASASFTGVVSTGQSQTLPLSQAGGIEVDLTVPGGPPVPPNTCL